MDFYTLAKERFSVRKFTNEPLKKEDLDKILSAGRIAPTACNLQPQKILVINDKEGLEKLKNCTRSHFDSLCALLVCYDKNECWERRYDGKKSGEIDSSIVTTHMMLQAKEIGVSSTWVMSFDPFKMRESFSVPLNYEMVSLLVLGYADNAEPTLMHSEKKPLKETVFYNKF